MHCQGIRRLDKGNMHLTTRSRGVPASWRLDIVVAEMLESRIYALLR